MKERELILFSDIHGNPNAIERIMEYNKQECEVIFLGDFIDRGDRHTETIVGLAALKTKFGDKCKLICGNHDRWMYVTLGLDPVRTPLDDISETLWNRYSTRQVIKTCTSKALRPFVKYIYENSCRSYTIEHEDIKIEFSHSGNIKKLGYPLHAVICNKWDKNTVKVIGHWDKDRLEDAGQWIDNSWDCDNFRVIKTTKGNIIILIDDNSTENVVEMSCEQIKRIHSILKGE